MNDSEPSSRPAPVTPPPRSGFNSPWFLAALASLVVVVPTLVWQWPLERDRWTIASAIQARKEGHKEKAFDKVGEVIHRSPKNLLGYLVRAQWHLDDEEFEKSLADINQALELEPADTALLMRRSMILQKMGRHEDAVADLTDLLARTSLDRHDRRAELLNAAAYASAVGNIRLSEALKQVEEALKIEPDSPAILDTKAFVLYRQGELTDAERVMNRTMELFEPEFKAQEAAAAAAAKRSRGNSDIESALKAVRRNAAVLYYHRGVIREKLGAVEESKADYDRVKELGFTPGEDLY